MVRLWPVVGLRFQVLFHSPRRGSFRLSLTVLLRYRSYLVFSLGSWSTQFPAGFLVPRRTQDSATLQSTFRIRGFHPLWQAFPDLFTTLFTKTSRSYNLWPLILYNCFWLFQLSILKKEWSDLGSSDFARRYFRNLFWFLFPRYLDGSVPSVSLP